MANLSKAKVYIMIHASCRKVKWMKKNRGAFTYIELIFVIMISGLLIGVALPKFIHMQEEAKRTNLMTFVDTLNITVGPTMWQKAIVTHNGSVTSSGANLCAHIEEYIEVPNEVTAFSADCRITVNPDLGVPILNTFEDGSATTSPKWTIRFH